MNLLRIALAINTGLLLACTSCYGEEGIVVDKTNGKPISGAVVLLTWHGVVRTPVQAASQCYKAEVTVTDASGRFHASTFSGNLNPLMADRRREVTVLASGLRKSPDSQDLHIVMEQPTGTKSERFQRLPGTQATGCHNVDRRTLLPYLKALHAEMSLLAETKEEKLQTSSVLAHIDYIEVGDMESLRRSSQRRSAIEQENRK